MVKRRTQGTRSDQLSDAAHFGACAKDLWRTQDFDGFIKQSLTAETRTRRASAAGGLNNWRTSRF